MLCMDPEGGSPLKNHIDICFFSNTGSDPLTNHKTTKSAFNVWPSSVRQRNAMAFWWRGDDVPLIVVFGSTLPLSTKKEVKVGPPLTKLSGSAHGCVDPADLVWSTPPSN